MITKEEWEKLNKDEKLAKTAEALSELESITSRKHELYGRPEQGKLVDIKKAREEEVLTYLKYTEEILCEKLDK